jgi:hypothetical protein
MKERHSRPAEEAGRGMRKLLIDGRQVYYRVGSRWTKIRLPDGTSKNVSNCEILGVTPSTFERGQRKRTSDGMVTPAFVAGYARGLL